MSQKNSAFEAADADLRVETHAASVAIENLTNKRGSLHLGEAQEKDDGVWYELWLRFAPPDQAQHVSRSGSADRTKKYLLATFFVPWTGYPIRTGINYELPDRASIANRFVDMARNPASPLVNYLAFNLRHQEQAAASG
jgi:hypothetical protein